jgi:hypothetical protein
LLHLIGKDIFFAKFFYSLDRVRVKKLEDEAFVQAADKRYKEWYPKDVHPSNILRAKYFNDRLKVLKAKQQFS